LAESSTTLRLLLQGGLGNQLFQIVLAQTLSRHFGKPLCVDSVLLHSRLRHLRGLTPRSLSLLLAQCLPLCSTPWHHWVGARFAARCPWVGTDWILTDQSLNLAVAQGSLLDQLSAVRLLHTHATHPALFGAPFHQAWLDLAGALKPLQVGPLPVLALHVRRGDYLHPSSGFFALEACYYHRALAAIQTRSDLATKAGFVGSGPAVVNVFTDDPAWCRTHLGIVGWEVRIEQGTPEQDLARMAAARVLITSNSSFSAVAAHLVGLRDPSAVVLCPDRWLIKEDGRLGDLRCPHWLAVEV